MIKFINETHFKRFLMIIRSAGFIDKSMIRSGNALNFAYILYLKLKRDLGNEPKIESWVRRWFVLSVVTGRYSGSPESMLDKDIKAIHAQDFAAFITDIEAAELSDGFWQAGLPQNLITSSTNSPPFKVFLAAQVYLNDKGFLSKDISVRNMLEHHGDIHHIFPRNYLKKQGLTQTKYNQIANYVYVQQEVNIKIGDRSPMDYLGDVFKQCESGEPKYGVMTVQQELLNNLQSNCLPTELTHYDYANYETFLAERRELMAKKIKQYYQSL